MKIVLLHLITGQYLISKIDELDEEPAVHLIDPYELVELESGFPEFIKYPRYRDTVDIVMHSERVITICNPTKELIRSYMDILISNS